MKNILKISIEKIVTSKIYLYFSKLYLSFFDMCSLPFEILNKLKVKNKISIYYKENQKKDYLFLILTVLFISVILFHKFIFGKFLFIYNEHDMSRDNICGLYPYIYHVFRNPEGLSWWSFNSGIGNNMFLLILQFFIDPFNILGAVLWDPIENGFIYMHILKLICIAVVFYKLILTITENRYCALLTSLLFTFNGFVMLWGQHYYITNQVLYFISLLYAIEVYFRSKKKLFLVLLLVINLTHIYFFYQSIFFIGIYILFRNLYLSGNLKNIVKQIGSLILIGIIAFLISAIFVLPSIYVLGSGPRISTGKFSLNEMVFTLNSLDYYLTLFSEMFSNNLSGNGLNYFGWGGHYMLPPHVYSGLVTLLLIPQLIGLKDKNQRKSLILISVLSIVTLILPFFAYLFTAFQELYFRWTYGIITFNLISSAIILNAIFKNKILNVRLLQITSLILFSGLILFWMYYRRHDGEWMKGDIVGVFYADKNHYIQNQLIVILLFLVIYFVLIQCLNKYKVISGVLLLLVISSEIIIENYPTFYARGIVEKGKNPYLIHSAKVSNDLIRKVKKKDSTPFYRIEKQFFSFSEGLAQNESVVSNYFGLKTYNSCNSKAYYDFCQYFHLIDKGHWPNLLPSLKPNIERYSLLKLLSIKYLISKDSIRDNSFVYSDKLQYLLLYENIDFRSLGVTYSKFITKEKMSKHSDELKDSLVLDQLILEKEDVKILGDYLKKDQKRENFKINFFSNSLIKGEIFNSSKNVLFFSIPFDKGWEIKVNGVVSNYYKVNIGFIGLPLEKGKNKIELSYTPPMYKIGKLISIISVLGCALFYVFSVWKRKNS